MASTNKTTKLKLNSWIGSDAPKRIDFVDDNKKIDDYAIFNDKKIEDIKTQLDKKIDDTVIYINNKDSEIVSLMENKVDNINLNIDILSEKTLENTLTQIKTDSTLTKLPNSENGFVRNMQIKGKTLQNLVVGGDIAKEVKKSNDTLAKYGYIYNLKPNTKYTIQFNASKNSEGDIIINFNRGLQGAGIIQPVKSGLNKFTITTTNDSYSDLWIYYSGSADVVEYFTVSNIVILEGDWTNKEIPPYFEGIKSTAEAEGNKISILTRGKNLFRGTLESGRWTLADGTAFVDSESVRTKNKIRVKPNTTYTVKMFSNQNLYNVSEYNNNIFINTVNNDNTNKITFTTNSNTNCIHISMHTTNLESKLMLIESNIIPTNYEEPKEDKTTILLSSPHMGLPDGTNDIINFDKSERIKNVGKIVFDGSDDEKWGMILNTKSQTIIFARPNINDMYTVESTSTVINAITNKFISLNANEVWQSDTKEGICQDTPSKTIKINIFRNKLETPDLAGFKKLLKSWADAGTPLEVYYQLANPVTEKLNIKDTLQSFENGYIQLDNAITPTTQLEYSTNLPSAIGGLTQITDKLVDNVSNLSNPNLLINGNFQVWQRGDNFTFDSRTKYCADRWAMFEDVFKTGNGSISYLTGNRNELIIRPSEKNVSHFIQQSLEKYISEYLAGKYITCSIKIRTLNALDKMDLIFSYSHLGEVSLAGGTSQLKKSITIKERTDSIINFTALVPSDTKGLSFSIGASFNDTTSEDYLAIEYVKLELGSVATPFVPRLYAEELALCQRYYETSKSGVVKRFRNVLSMDTYPGELGFNTQFLVEKRVIPKVTFWYNISDSEEKHKDSVSVNEREFTDWQLLIPINKHLDVNSWIADAEIY